MENNNITSGSMLRKGTILHGTYRIDNYLSSGGFGNTYIATNIHFKDKVAVKEFFMKGVSLREDNNTFVTITTPDNKNTFDTQREKFLKEAQRIHSLKSDHIVRVSDFFDENGTSYYVMNYIDGESLAEHLKRTGKGMSEKEVISILRQVLEALSVAYSKDPPILHLDIKPGNIMLDKKGNAFLIDFGASKQLESSLGGVTVSTAISYTNGYAPLEQMEKNPSKFGQWTDIYALGATMYALLTNYRPPMPSNLMDDATVLKSQTLLFPSGVSESTKNLIAWMMQTNRHNRPQTVEQIFSYLNEHSFADILDNRRQSSDSSGGNQSSETELDPPPPPNDDSNGGTPPPLKGSGSETPPPPPPPFDVPGGSTPPPLNGGGIGTPPPMSSGLFPPKVEFNASLNEGFIGQGGKIIITPTQFIFHPYSLNFGDTRDRVFNISDYTKCVRETVPTWLDLYFNNKCYLFIVFSRETIIREIEMRKRALQG